MQHALNVIDELRDGGAIGCVPDLELRGDGQLKRELRRRRVRDSEDASSLNRTLSHCPA
jgi:hypothetical protein